MPVHEVDHVAKPISGGVAHAPLEDLRSDRSIKVLRIPTSIAPFSSSPGPSPQLIWPLSGPPGPLALWTQWRNMEEHGLGKEASGVSPSPQVASMNQRRVDFYLASIEDMLVAVGGRNENGALSSVETYSPKTNSWTYVAGLPR